MGSMSSFSAFNLSPNLVSSLVKMGYKEPSLVQTAVIPKALRGESLLAKSPTGSGKTHAFLIPLIQKTDMSLPRLQSIIVAPTRELARQTYAFAREFCRYFPKFTVRLFTSEADVSDNEEGLSSGKAPHMVIGTPGRLNDILAAKHLLNLHNVRTIVLDEADMLLDLGYFEPIESLFSVLKDPQTLVFSATLRQDLKDELRKFVKADFEFEADENANPDTVSHHLIDIRHAPKAEALASFLKIRRPYLAIVFASKKETVKELYSYLNENGFSALLYSGDLSDRSRKKALREIRNNSTPIIVASDLLSRGMDIPDVSDVISVDLPDELEYYLHRSGRTGRFGKKGDSWVFYDDDSEKLPKELIALGVKFDFYSLRKGELKEDPVGLLPKKKLSRKKEFSSEEEKLDIKLAKAKTRTNEVKPSYKKKRKWAIDKVKKKYKRKAIQRSIRKELTEKWKDENKRNNGQD